MKNLNYSYLRKIIFVVVLTSCLNKNKNSVPNSNKKYNSKENQSCKKKKHKCECGETLKCYSCDGVSDFSFEVDDYDKEVFDCETHWK